MVENKPGATGLIGVQELAKSAPDGYIVATIKLAVVVAQALVPGTQVNLLRDTAAVAMPFRQYTILLVAVNPCLIAALRRIARYHPP